MSEKAKDAIMADLASLRRERRSHFGLAATLLAVMFAVVVTMMPRAGLLDQPWPQLVAQVGLALLGLVALPAIGVGLWFPTRATQIGLAVVAIVAAMVGGVTWSFADAGAHTVVLTPGCLLASGAVGAVLLGVAALSGAFVQCRRPSANGWVAAGLGLLTLASINSTCSDTAVGHVLTHHWGAMVALIMFAWLQGTRARNAAGRTRDLAGS